LSLGRTSINCQDGRSFAARCFRVKTETLAILRS